MTYPDPPESRFSWRGRPVQTGIEPRFRNPPRGAPPGLGDNPPAPPSHRPPRRGGFWRFVWSFAKFAFYAIATVFILELIFGPIDQNQWEEDLASRVPPLQAIVEGQLLFYVEPIPDYVSDDVEEAIYGVIDDIASLTPYEAWVNRTFQPSQADIHINWVRDFGGDHLGTELSAHIDVGLGSTNCTGDWQAFDSDTVKHVLWHEIGHAFGYSHSPKPSNVMYNGLRSRFEIYHDISDVIPPGWYITTPICEPGDYKIELAPEEYGNIFYFAVAPAGTEPEDVVRGHADAATACPSGSFQAIEEECQLSQKDLLIISNGTDDVLEIKGAVVLTSPREPVEMKWDPKAYNIDQDLIDHFLDTYRD